MNRKQINAKQALERAMREALERQRLERKHDSAVGTTNDLPKGRRQELRDRYGLTLPDTVPVAPDPTARPAVLHLNEMAKGVTLPAGIHRRLAEACGAPPLVALPEGLHERLAAALGHRRQRETGA
jgi:hypothetical protein